MIYLLVLFLGAIGAMLRQIDKRDLTFVLKGTTQELQERFFDNMSSKASGEFRDKMASVHFLEQTKRQNTIKKHYLLAERLRDNDKIHVTKNVSKK
jgi:flagellar motor switch protein FliG